MPSGVFNGQRSWSMTRDRDGQREYKIKYLVEVLDRRNGPASALVTPGLPIPGDFWIVDNDIDLWATCKLDAEVKQAAGTKDNQPAVLFEVTFTFSTKGDEKRCKDQQIDNPILQPQQVSGGFKTYQEEATYDRFGLAITNSAFEVIRGQQVEFDKNRPTVKIQQNVSDLQLGILASMQDTVNDATLWGFPRRCVKLGNVTWERKFYGLCFVYYSRTLEFECRYDGFDKYPLDEGTKVLSGHWDPNGPTWILDPIKGYSDIFPDAANPDPFNPQHFIRFTDRQGNPSKVLLTGLGTPVGVTVGSGATATALLWDAEFVQAVLVTNEGSGYEANPPVTFTGGGGSGAAAVAVVEDGKVTEIIMLNGGEDYDTAPTVTIGGTVGQPHPIPVQKYGESNFLLLGIPTQF